jgi:DNA polymerase sigma
MNTKTEAPVATKAVSEAKTDAKTAVPEKEALPASSSSKRVAQPDSQTQVQAGAGTSSNALSPEIIELVTELRDTTKGLNPRKHTAKTLRRALSNVSAILADIEQLYQQD